MARQARLRLPGYVFHLTQRGHNKAPIFLDDSCFLVYRSLLARMWPKHECRVHAYALMHNHIHMLLTGGHDDSLSGMMKAVNEQYGRYFNRRFARVGPVWQSRFWANVVDTSEYFLACCRYIDLNPVRAGLVARAGDYAWSSHRFHADGEASDIVTAHPTYLALGSTQSARGERYRRLAAAPLTHEELERIRGSLRSGLPLGGTAFCAELADRFGVKVALSKPGPRKKASDQAIQTSSSQQALIF
jgi:putative transposase